MFRYFNMGFWFLGLLLFFWAVKSVELSSVTTLILKMKWGLIVVLSVYILINLVDAVAWKCALKPDEAEPVTLGKLWKIRQIGEAFNMATPLGTMGGEPLKAHLLKENYGLSFKQSISSLVVSRTTNLLGLILFLIIGSILIFPSDHITITFKTRALIGFSIFSILILLFLFFQIHGGLKTIANWATKLPFGNAIKHPLDHLEILSHHLVAYYKENPLRCIESVWYSFVGWVVGILELYLTLFFLGQTLSFADLWIIEALVQLIRVGSFFIPLNLGALESGSILIFASMGMSANLGLAVSFVRRIKELTWIALGLGMSGTMAFKPTKAKED